MHGRKPHRLATVASAPVKAIELLGGSPNQGNRYHPVTKGNCVAARQGGEQLEVKEQSVMLCELDSAKPVRECPSIARTFDRTNVPMKTHKVCPLRWSVSAAISTVK